MSFQKPILHYNLALFLQSSLVYTHQTPYPAAAFLSLSVFFSGRLFFPAVPLHLLEGGTLGTLPPLHHHFYYWMINFLTQNQNQVGASLEMMVTVSFSQESMAMIWAIPLISNWKVAKVVPDHYLMANSEAVAVFLQETNVGSGGF